MNVWKPIALCSVAALAVSVSMQTAHAGGACGNQPNMAAGLEHMQGAKASLGKAEHNKGGWRDRAMAGLETAIRETQAGCAAAN